MIVNSFNRTIEFRKQLLNSAYGLRCQFVWINHLDQSQSIVSLECKNVHLRDWICKKHWGYWKKTQFSPWCQKKSRKRWKLISTNFVWDSMRTHCGTEEDNIYHVLFTWILDNYGKYIHVNTRQIWQWDRSTCATITGFQKAQVVDLALFGKFFSLSTYSVYLQFATE